MASDSSDRENIYFRSENNFDSSCDQSDMRNCDLNQTQNYKTDSSQISSCNNNNLSSDFEKASDDSSSFDKSTAGNSNILNSEFENFQSKPDRAQLFHAELERF